jgi:ATP-binding cassette subfamily B (MDR/TAP) protein 1
MPESWRDAEANASSSASVAAADSSPGNGKGGGGGGGAAVARGERAASASASARVPFHKLFAFADKTDAALMALGTLGAVANGAALPFMTVLFGNLIDAFGGAMGIHDVVNRVSMVSLEFIYLAIASAVASFVRKCWNTPLYSTLLYCLAAKIAKLNLLLDDLVARGDMLDDPRRAAGGEDTEPVPQDHPEAGDRLLRQVHQHRRGRRQDVRRHRAHPGRHGREGELSHQDTLLHMLNFALKL